jgi:FMN reductase (NADPH)
MDERSRVDEMLGVFERHRTIRAYTSAKIPEADIARIIQAGRRAPTDATGFMYTVIRVRDWQKRASVQEATQGNPHIVAASDFFVVCLDFHRQGRFLEHIGAKPAKLGAWSVLFGVTDAVLVAENMAVAAEALGYGTGFIGGVQKDALKIARILGCPAGVFPIVGLTIGVIERLPEPRKRLPTSATFHEDTYHELSAAEVAHCFEAMKSESGKFDWSASLRRYFAEGGEMESREATIRASLAAQGLPL